MKKIITLLLVASSLFFAGCDQKTNNEVSDTSSAASASVKEKAVLSKDVIKAKVEKSIDTHKEVMNP